VADPDVAEAMARSFLGKLPLDLVDELLAEGERTDYPAGTTIYREGAAPRAVLVIKGLLRVYMTSAEGRQVTVRYARDADVLGIAVLVGGPVNVAVQTALVIGLGRGLGPACWPRSCPAGLRALTRAGRASAYRQPARRGLADPQVTVLTVQPCKDEPDTRHHSPRRLIPRGGCGSRRRSSAAALPTRRRAGGPG
jgi:Cyclic nucleotide-binding domain